MSDNRLLAAPASDDRQWQVERYVLEDPTLDRQTFEASMAEDVELALAVAECVARLQRLAVACHGRPVVDSPAVESRPATRPLFPAVPQLSWLVKRWTVKRSTANRWAVATASLSAALAVAFVAWNSLPSASPRTALIPSPAPQGGEHRLTEVAQLWLALDRVSSDNEWLPSESNMLTSGGAASELVDPEIGLAELDAHAQVSVVDENDWMLQVAAAFFEETGG